MSKKWWCEAHLELKSIKKLTGSEHFWKLRYWKSARRCGAKHISKSNCTKYATLRALSEVEMFKKCMSLWRKAHFEVKSVKNWRVRITFWSWDVQKVHAVVAQSTFRCQNVKNTPRSDHFWTFNPTMLHNNDSNHNHNHNNNNYYYHYYYSYSYSYYYYYYSSRATATTLQLQQHQPQLRLQRHYNTTATITTAATPLYYTTLHYTPLHHTSRLPYNYNYNDYYSYSCNYNIYNSNYIHYSYNYTTIQLQLQLQIILCTTLYTTLHPAAVVEVTTATTPKSTTPTSFPSINGFALPSMHHNPLL